MKKILSLALACTCVAALGSCNKKAAATPGATAKHYVERVVNDDYESFVRAISFTEPVSKSRAAEVEKVHAAALRTIQHPRTVERGGIKTVKVVSEKMSPDNKTCNVVLANHYNNGDVATVEMLMAKENNEWKVRERPNKEIWKSTDSNGDTEIVKVRTGGEREFVKDKVRDMGEKQFVKDINHAGGETEVVKVLEDGTRHKEVFGRTGDEMRGAGREMENAAGKAVDKAVETGRSAVKSAENAAGKAVETGKAAVKSAENAADKAAEKALPKR